MGSKVAKVDLNLIISDFDEILLLKIEKQPPLRGNIIKYLDLPGLKLIVVLMGISKNI